MESTVTATRKPPQVGAFERALYNVNAHKTVPRALARQALLEVLRSNDESQDARLGALLMGLVPGASANTIAGLVEAVMNHEYGDDDPHNHKITLPVSGKLVALAGSGKKSYKTINISTPAMVVATAMGVCCAKAGSRSTSSVTGSSDILRLAGFRIPKSRLAAINILQATGFGFFSIENAIPKFDAVYGGKFFAPHALSYVLPAALVPIECKRILYGYAGPNIELSALALSKLGFAHVSVYNNTADHLHYIDELSTYGISAMVMFRNNSLHSSIKGNLGDLLGVETQAAPHIEARATPQAQYAVFRDIIFNKVPESSAENHICLNAALIAQTAGTVADLTAGFHLARETIRAGRAGKKIQDIITASHDFA